MKRFYFLYITLCIIGLIVVTEGKRSNLLGKLSFSEGPKIFFSEAEKDFGTITQGDFIVYEFPFENIGNQDLVISNVSTSCGCTAATAGDKKSYAPGEKGSIKITFNSNSKEGKIEKTVLVSTNDPETPNFLLTLFFNVNKPGSEQVHMNLMEGSSIFVGVCRDCHVNQGAGKIGKELFDADCSICHGDKADHKPHGPIDKNSVQKYSDKELFDYISNGSPDLPTMMPGFHMKNSGPLTTEEINTLVTFLRSDLSINSIIK